jgi:hypothetical protein
MTKTNKNPDAEMENLLNEDYKETMQGRKKKERIDSQVNLLN